MGGPGSALPRSLKHAMALAWRSRRAFLGTAAGAAAASLAARDAPASPHPRRLKLGLASYSLRKFSLDQAIDMCRAMDVRYITLKDVKRRWGQGHEDVFPVCQFEKLWGDMTALPEVNCGFVVVPRERGQQLKDQAQLDGWLRDGSAAQVATQCAWE